MCDNFLTGYDKCDTNNTLYGDRDDTCATVLKTLEISVIGTCKVRKTHFHKGDILESLEQAHTCNVTTNMSKYDTFPFLRNKSQHNEKTKKMSLKICDSNEKTKEGSENWYWKKFWRGL